MEMGLRNSAIVVLPDFEGLTTARLVPGLSEMLARHGPVSAQLDPDETISVRAGMLDVKIVPKPDHDYGPVLDVQAKGPASDDGIVAVALLSRADTIVTDDGMILDTLSFRRGYRRKRHLPRLTEDQTIPKASRPMRAATWLMTGLLTCVSLPVGIFAIIVQAKRGAEVRLVSQCLSLSGLFSTLSLKGYFAGTSFESLF